MSTVSSLPAMFDPQKFDKMDPMQNQLCRVCDEPAAGFHFGAFTCEGCKSFFGRTCNNQSVIAECKNNYRCVVDKKNRTSCKACRLRKCLMVGMSKSGSRYGRRSNWFKIHCLMQANSNKRPPHPSPSLPPHPPHLTPSAPPPPVSSLSGSQESQLPPTLRWPMAPSLSRLSLPPLQVPQSPVPKSLSAFESYANLLKQAEAKMEKKTDDIEESDHISVSRSPSPQPQVSPSPLNISSISDTSSKSSHSLLSEENRNNILEINKNLGSFGQQSPDLSKLPSGTPSHPLFPFGLSPPQMPPSLSHLYNPLSFAASPLYRLRNAVQIFRCSNNKICHV